MSGSNKNIDNKKGDEVLAKMLKTPPKVNETLAKSDAKEQPSDDPAKNSRSAKSAT